VVEGSGPLLRDSIRIGQDFCTGHDAIRQVALTGPPTTGT
jgi:hypothetical protein